MIPAQIVDQIQSLGAQIRVTGGDLCISAPTPLPEAIVAAVRRAKADVVAYLSPVPKATLYMSGNVTFDARVKFGRLVEGYCRERWAVPPAVRCAACEAPKPTFKLPDGSVVCDRDDFACLIQYGTRRKEFGAAEAVTAGHTKPEGWNA